MRSVFCSHLDPRASFCAARWLSLALLALLATVCAACDSSEASGSTQVTARIYFASDVRAALSTLRVRSYRSDGGEFTLRAELSYAKSKLDEVMDVRFTPSGNDLAGTLLIVADALSASGEVLVEARATFVFVPGEQRLFELWLYRCGGAPLGELCAEPSCADLTCLTCVRDMCAATPLYSKPQLTAFDPTLAADPAKLPPGHRPSEQEPTDADVTGDSGRDAEPEVEDAGSTAEDDACAEPCDGATTPDGGDVDGGLDAGPDMGPLDAGAHDATASDAGEPSDALASDANDADAQEPPGRCALEANWTTSRANGPLPAQALVLAQHTNASGSLPQYLCRMRTPDGVILVPGKVSSASSSSTAFDHGCYGVFYGPRPGRGTQAWQSFDSETLDIDFQVLTPASECQLDWVATTSAQGLPARALAVGNTGGATPQPLYACRVNVTDSATSGTHIGRVGGADGDSCRVQYYQQSPLERSQFEVLVQTRP